jgi:hypothetical protein
MFCRWSAVIVTLLAVTDGASTLFSLLDEQPLKARMAASAITETMSPWANSLRRSADGGP